MIKINLKTFFCVILWLIQFSIVAQEDSTECFHNTNPYLTQILEKAKEQMRTSPNTAYTKMVKAIKIQPLFSEAYFVLAEIDYQRAINFSEADNQQFNPENYFTRAVANFEKVIELCPKLNNYLSYYYLGEYYYDHRNFEKAKFYLDEYRKKNISDFDMLKITDEFIANIDWYYRSLQNPVPFRPNCIEHINTENDEFLPLLSPDGELLFYTRKYSKIDKNLKEQLAEEFLFSTRINKSTDSIEIFSPGKIMPFPFNQGLDQGGASITIDNRFLYITICESIREKYTSYKNCDIFVSEFINNSWSQFKSVGININNVSTWEAQPSVTADGKVLFFASARPGGFGGTDIYRSVMDAEGNWGQVENLGPEINTEKDDKTPYIHPDGKTLYFSSNGRFGMGGFDIFYSQYIGNGRWSKPENLGYPINTEDDEVAFSISTQGDRFYFSSRNLKGKGGWDVFSSVLPQNARPEHVLFFKGNIFDNKGILLKNATIELQSIKTLKLTKGLVDPLTGKYAIAMGVMDKEDFIMTIKKPGYFFESEYVRPNDKILRKPIEKNFQMHPIEVGTKIKLKNIYFETNSANIDSVSVISLNNFLEFVNVNPSIKIDIYGHTDNVGSSEANLDLSKRRAKAIADFLIDHGINPERVSYKGFGETRPVSPNITRKGRAENRRSEFVVTIK